MVYRTLAWLIASVVTAMIGPFSTYSALGFGERLFYWGGLIGVSMISGYSVRAVILRRVGNDGVRTDLYGAIAQSLLLGPLIWVFNYSVLGFDVAGVVWFVEHILVVFGVCIAVCLLRQYLRSFRAVEGAEPARVAESSAPSPDAPAFLRRLDGQLSGDLVRVSANDHYLEVETHSGVGRVLMRFRDALEELQEAQGFQIHRSHWVAQHALQEVRQDGRRHVAVLACGQELPVSRAYLDDLRRAGYAD